jgi:hypothetical protein
MRRARHADLEIVDRAEVEAERHAGARSGTSRSLSRKPHMIVSRSTARATTASGVSKGVARLRCMPRPAHGPGIRRQDQRILVRRAPPAIDRAGVERSDCPRSPPRDRSRRVRHSWSSDSRSPAPRSAERASRNAVAHPRYASAQLDLLARRVLEATQSRTNRQCAR